ncbi:MAG: PAS domain S-box protein [Peptococcaceae bacterium]|nr:PAS domain S-box protein [Peptococcaceae bacterium]
MINNINNSYEQIILRLEEEIARRKELEESLRKSEEKYRATFEYTGTAMIVIEENTVISMANKEIERLTGFSREEIAGKKSWTEFVAPEDLERMLEYHQQRRRGDPSVPSSYEFKLINKNGEVRDIFFTIGMIPGTKQSVGSLIDITEMKRTGRALRESEERYRMLLDNIEDGFYEVDLKGNFTFFNDPLLKAIGYTREELMGTNFRKLVDEENLKVVFKAYNKVYTTGRPDRGFVWELIRRDGSKIFVDVSVSPIKNDMGKITGFRGIARDITERQRIQQRLNYLSMHDTLTGLYNRAHFEDQLQAIGNAGRGSPLAIICCDVDGLKLFNDTWGHKRGDELLKAAADAISQPFREPSMVARIGGDEFVVLMPRTDGSGAEKARSLIKEAVDCHNLTRPDLPLLISIGWASGDPGETCVEEIFKRADNNMYREKLKNGETSRKAIVRSLMKALEDRDGLARGHLERLEKIAVKIGEMYNLSSREMAELRLLAQFHDIGKVGISGRVVSKQGPLSPTEWDEIKRHCEIGYRIALSSPDLAPIARNMLAHHEWWDGRGYPLGVKGEEIPLPCRILAVADAYEVMTGSRAVSHEEAIEEIRRGAGTQFDPEVVDKFIRSFNNGDK